MPMPTLATERARIRVGKISKVSCSLPAASDPDVEKPLNTSENKSPSRPMLKRLAIPARERII